MIVEHGTTQYQGPVAPPEQGGQVVPPAGSGHRQPYLQTPSSSNIFPTYVGLPLHLRGELPGHQVNCLS